MAKQKMHTLYLYSTESIKYHISRPHDGKDFWPRGKAGQTKLDNANERIKQQDGTSSFEPLQRLADRNVPSWLTDGLLRKKICSYESKTGLKYQESREEVKREWITFYGEETPEDMVRIWNEAINDILYSSRAPQDFTPLEHQQQIIDQALAHDWKENPILLINAIMRSGKCFISYEIVRAFNEKNILVITAKPGVNDSWAELLPGGEDPHVNYVNWQYYDYKKCGKSFDPTKIDPNKTNVFFVSLQWINSQIKKGIPSKLGKWIFANIWDTVIFDEQHYATVTENTNKVFEMLQHSSRIELSGTPYKTLLSKRIEHVINYDYVDEQRIRKTSKDPFYQLLADQNWCLLEVPDKVKNLILPEDGEDVKGFTFSKLLGTVGPKGAKKLKGPQSVDEFLTFVQKRAYKSPPEKFKHYPHLNRHSLWVWPDNVEGIREAIKIAEQHPYFKKYRHINASGGNVTQIEEVKSIISRVEAEGDYQGTIVHTCSRFGEGTSVPEWWTVHQMNDDKSASDYFQSCFRNKTPWKAGDKRSVLVYDYSPNRFLSVLYETRLDMDNNKSTSENIREFLEVSDVFDYTDNEWKVISGNDVIGKVTQDIEMNTNLFSGKILIDKTQITDVIRQMMKDKDLSKVGSTTVVNTNEGVEAGKNCKTQEKEDEKKEQEEKEPTEDETVEKIQSALRNLPALLYNAQWNKKQINCVTDIYNYPDNDFVSRHTGLDCSEWYRLSASGCLTKRVNKRIDAYLMAMS